MLFPYIKDCFICNFVVCLDDSVIIFAISCGICLLRIVYLIIEQQAVSSLVIVDVSLVCSMAKLITLCCLVAEVGSLAAFAVSEGTKIESATVPESWSHLLGCLVFLSLLHQLSSILEMDKIFNQSRLYWMHQWYLR